MILHVYASALWRVILDSTDLLKQVLLQICWELYYYINTEGDFSPFFFCCVNPTVYFCCLSNLSIGIPLHFGGEGGKFWWELRKVWMSSRWQRHELMQINRCRHVHTHPHTHPKSHLRRQERLSPEDNGQTALCVFFHFGSKRRNES